VFYSRWNRDPAALPQFEIAHAGKSKNHARMTIEALQRSPDQKYYSYLLRGQQTKIADLCSTDGQ